MKNEKKNIESNTNLINTEKIEETANKNKIRDEWGQNEATKIYKLFTENKNSVHFNKHRSNSEYNFFY